MKTAKAVAASQQIDRMIGAATMGMLVDMIQKLDKKDRDESEGLVFGRLTAELSKRLRAQAGQQTTEALLADYKKFAGEDFKTMDRLGRAGYWAVSGEMESRFPKAAAAANEWLDNLTSEQLEGMDGNGWDTKFLTLVEGGSDV